MRRPSFQFYPADWRNNANLRRCSWEARGVWVEVMGLMHDSDEYGMLRWPLKEIAQALGAPVKLVLELSSKGVMKGVDSGQCEAMVYTPRSGRKDGEPVDLVPSQPGPIWYSSRMVKDEHVRTIRGEGTRFGDSPKDSPIPPLSDGSTSSSTATHSPSLRSGEGAAAQRAPRQKREDITLTTYLKNCREAGRKPLPADHEIRAYCRDAGISDEMLQVAWCVFRDGYTNGTKKAKRYKDWPAHFANAVRGCWDKLWYTDAASGVAWTSRGLQEKGVLDARARTKEGDHGAA